MTHTKTIIDEIQARHERHLLVQDEIKAMGRIPCELSSQTDRSTLLSILAEIGALPDHWWKYDYLNPKADSFMDAADCADQLKAILKRTQAGT